MIIKDYKQAAQILLNGGVGVILTDTVYGLSASVTSKAAVRKLYALKDRHNKPGTIIASNINQLTGFGINKVDLEKASRYWPGPYSIILKLSEDLSYLNQSVGSSAIRVVSDPRVRQLLDLTGPLLTSSANQPAQPTSKNINEAVNYFGDLVDFYLDNGYVSNQIPSTIIRINGDNQAVIRQGLTNK